MNKKHPNGYWVQQLTDENAKDLLVKLVSSNQVTKFKRIYDQTRTDDSISVKYISTRTKRYLSYAESTLIITDYKLNGQYSHAKFYEFMIELFGEEYAKDLLAYAKDYIAKNPDDSWSKRLTSLVNKVPAMVDKRNQSTSDNL